MMKRELEVRAEHATLVGGGGPLTNSNQEGCCDLVARVSHHVRRYIDSDTWDQVSLYKRHKKIIDELVTGAGAVPEDTEHALMSLSEEDYVAVVTLAEKMHSGAEAPKEVYTGAPVSATDVVHMKYLVCIYALDWCDKRQAFTPVRFQKHKRHGYLSFWQERELDRLTLSKVKRYDPNGTYLFLKNLKDRAREAAAFRATTKLTGNVSLGSELYRAIPGVSALHLGPVVEAAGSTPVADYVRGLADKPLPKAWFTNLAGEEPAGFRLNNDVLPAVVLPKNVKQRLWLRGLPEPMMEVCPGLNTPDVW